MLAIITFNTLKPLEKLRHTRAWSEGLGMWGNGVGEVWRGRVSPVLVDAGPLT